MSGKVQNATALVATLGATVVAKKAVDTTWKLGSGKTPPTDPADPDIAFREAMVWAILSGAAVSVARTLLARRLAQSERRKARVKGAVGLA